MKLLLCEIDAHKLKGIPLYRKDVVPVMRCRDSKATARLSSTS